jgi:indolepyruvate ferredoxin oxidoreductase
VPGGVHIAWENMPLAVEQRLHVKLERAKAYARANGLDRVAVEAPERRLGIVTTGKAYLDVRQALEELGIDEERARAIGLSIYKVGLVWPLEPAGALDFARGHEELLVVEEKKAILEEQLAHLLYNEPERPRIIGKRDETGQTLLPVTGELTPGLLTEAIGDWLERRVETFDRARTADIVSLPVQGGGGLMRLPGFCSGCPHTRPTKTPDGSVALGGIGCHGMAVWLPDRSCLAVTQMGGEGTNWLGIAPFSDTDHIFQNMGDGTYFHSGVLAIRAAVAAGANITYKILLNGAVAMTGGQPIEGEEMAGEITTPEVVQQLLAEGLARIDVVTDDTSKYKPGTIPPKVRVHHRDALDRVQRQLRETPGVTAIIYDQTCAAEARRLRKRGELPEPEQRVVINERVCEGCGDCSVQSNCIAIEPVETTYGRKRRINQSSCNKDYSCLLGYCPSFVTVTGGSLRKRSAAGTAQAAGDHVFDGLPDPEPAPCDRPFNIFVAGIGGTGVITVGALLGMAAHLEGKGTSLLDVTGLAQKNGPVSSHVRIAARPDDLFATRIAAGAADLVLGCDIVVTTSADGLARMSPARTTAVVNTHVAPTADFATNADLDLSSKAMEDAVARACGESGLHAIEATKLATALFGDAIAANLFMLGYAMQLGLIPVSLGALERAIELNGRAVDMNKSALRWGRLAAHDLETVRKAAGGEVALAAGPDESLDALVAARSSELVAYQGERLARRYRALVDRVAVAERRHFDDTPLAEAVARYAFKVMAYKDEYEVARLYTDGSFEAQLAEEFEGDYEVHLHLAPQLLPRSPTTGRPPKLKLGRWFLRVLGVIAKGRVLRGTFLDPTQLLAHRRLEQRLIRDYERLVDTLASGLTPDSRDVAIDLASLPEHVRGFDDIKEANLEAARAKERELLDRFHSRSAAG